MFEPDASKQAALSLAFTVGLRCHKLKPVEMLLPLLHALASPRVDSC
jgi:hypothetical protein